MASSVHSLPHSSVPKDAVVVPDAHLLFHGDFKRSGVDLILSGDDREIVLHDYFKGEKRAALSSPDGAHLTGDIVSALTGYVQVSQADGSVSVAKVIGHVTKLVGTATAIRNGVSIILHQGDNVEKGDVVQSGSNSTLGVTFIDGTVFGLSSNARMVLNEMVYDPNGSNNSSLISLVAGTISFVAGQTAKHGDMKIDTPVATMGIRGTAVLVEIDFTVPGAGGQPDAKFQVLVEPDGTTGSYILFDKTTLQPLAVVNQAGQQINISQGVITQTNAPLSPDVQKLINDVFTLKFTDNTNPKTNTGQNNSITPETGPVQKADNGATATPIVKTVSLDAGSTPTGSSSGSINVLAHIPGPPDARLLDLAGHLTSGFSITELIGTNIANSDIISGKVNFVDPNAGDTPSVKVDFSAFAYKNAQHQDVTAKLSLLQLVDIAKTEFTINVTPDPGNNNNGSATLTYTIADKAFDFLAAGETLTLTYVARVDTNFAPLNETTLIPFTITVTGTNDRPVITTGPQTVAFHGGTSEPGGSLPLTSNDPTSGTLTFTDVDLTDTHTVSVKLTSPVDSIPPAPLAFFEQALSAKIATDSTSTGAGTVSWTLADIPVYDADFIPAGETLTLTYTVTVADEHGATSTQTVTVTIKGTDAPAVVWIATTAGESSGGLWSNGSNWETGLAPTASDDTIIITDQLHGLTPSFPVTVDTQAFAKSLTMNDFDSTPPKLIVQSQKSLTISGVLKLSADSIVQNYGTISVGGKAEVLDHSTLQNSGTLNLGQGGDFVGQSSITNATGGTIEVTGGTLNVSVDIANSGHITIDSGAALVLNPSTITGGTITINGILELDGTSFLKTGTLNNDGTVDVKGADTFDGETVHGSGTLTVDAAAMLTLINTTIDCGTVTNKTGGEIDLDGNAIVKNGTLSNSGTIKVNGSGNALHQESVTANADLEILAGAALIIDQNSMITNSGTITIDGGATLTLNGATLGGGTINDYSIDAESHTVAGMIDVTGASTIEGNAILNQGGVTVASGVTLALGNVTVNGTAFSDAGATLSVGSGQTLTLQNGAAVTGGNLVIFGTLHLETSSGAHLDNVSVSGGGAIVVDDPSIDGMLFLADGTSITDGTMTIGGHGLLDVTIGVNGKGATLAGLTVDNSGIVQVDQGATLTLNDGKIVGGVLDIAGTFDSEGTSTLNGVTVTNTGTLDVVCGTLIIDASSTLTNSGTIAANGGNLEIDAAIAGKLEIDGASTLELGAADPDALITFAAGATGTLKIDHAETFKGTISGLDEGKLDLGGIAYHATDTASFADGILSVFVGGVDVANINLCGDYSGVRWALADDGHGGTILTEIPGVISAGLDQHGNASEGVAVMAAITDGGHAVTHLSYDWQIYDSTCNTWVDGSGTGVNAASYIPGEQDEGHLLRVSISFTDALGHVESQTVSAGTVAPVADVPVVTATASEICEGGTSNLTITLSNAPDLFENADDSVVVTVSLSDGAVLQGSGVHDNCNGTFTLTAHSATDLSGLTITPASEFEGSVTVGVSALAHDGTAVSNPGTTTTTLTVDDNDRPLTSFQLTHLPPVIDTTHFQIVQSVDGTMTITGLQVTDADPQASSEAFTLSASALHGRISSPSNESTDLQHINSDLSAVIYVPGNPQPQSDDVTLTITDSFGGSDTVHFIFNETGPPGNSNQVTLTGAGGKDVIIATAYDDTIDGGAGADQFVFAPSSSTNQDTITNFKPGEDHLDIRAFLTVDSTNINQWLSSHAVKQGESDTLLKLDDHDAVLLKGVQMSSLHSSDFIVSPHA